MRSSNGNRCFVMVRGVGSSLRLTWFHHSSRIMDKRNCFTPAALSKRHVAVRTIVVVAPYDIRSLYVCFTVRAMSLTCGGNSGGSTIDTAHSWGFLISFIFVPILGKRKNLRECVSAGVGSLFTGGASSRNRTTDGAGVACCTFVV